MHLATAAIHVLSGADPGGDVPAGGQNTIDYLLSLAKVLGLIAGVAAAGTVIAKSPLGRFAAWVWRHLFGEPAGEWARKQVETVVDEKLLARNGGTTIPDVVVRLDHLVRVVHDNGARLEQVIATIPDVTTRLDQVAVDVHSDHEAMVANHEANTSRLDTIEHHMEEAR